MIIKPPALLKAQIKYILSAARYTLYSGAYRSGKSTANIERLNTKATQSGRAVRGLFGMDTLSRIKDQFIPRLLKYFEEHYPPGWIAYSGGHAPVIRFNSNGSEVLFRGLEAPERIEGDEFDFIIVEEATKNVPDRAWDILYSRMSRMGSSFSATCNPGPKSHRLYSDFFLNDEGSHPEDQRFTVRAVMSENHFLPRQYVREMERRPDWWKRIYLYGEWGSPEGIIYQTFDPDRQIQDFQIDPTWKFFRAVDWGYNPDPFVCLFLAVSPDGTVYLFDEIYKNRMELADIERELKTRHSDLKFSWTVADSSRPELIKWLRGIVSDPVYRSKKGRDTIVPGIMKVIDRLWNTDGTPRLILKRQKTPKTAAEFQSYEWSDKPETPSDKSNHSMDALRYWYEKYLSMIPGVERVRVYAG